MNDPHPVNREEMRAAARALAHDYEAVAHVVGDVPAGCAQLCTVCCHTAAGPGDTHFEAGVVFANVRRATGQTIGHSAAGPGRPLGARETFELWEGERWCDVREEGAGADH
jgi:hypothetical protein